MRETIKMFVRDIELIRTVEKNSGLNISDLARIMSIPYSTAYVKVHKLEKAGLLLLKYSSGKKSIYLTKTAEELLEALEIIEKPPSAELRPEQKDQDTLPPYEILDRILYYYLDRGCSPDEIISKGFDADIVEWVVRAVDRSEYKRRQAPPGLKVTTKAFGIGRRMPIAAKYEY